MKQYELVTVFDGKVTAAKKKAAVEKIEKLVTVLEGKVVETLDWGVKELAYPINKLTSGSYFIFQLELPAPAAKAINEKLRLESEIIRYLLVTKDKELTRIRNHPKSAESENKNEQKS